MNRRPLIPVRSFKTDVYGTSLAIGPKAVPPVDQRKPLPGVENTITKPTLLREEQELKNFQRRRRAAMYDKRQFGSMLDTIKNGDIKEFKKVFSQASEDVKMMQRSGEYEDYETDEGDDEIFPYQTLLIHAFVYDNPEIFQILLVNHIDTGIDFVENAIKKKREIYLPGNVKTMYNMVKDYFMSIDTALNEKQEKMKRNALRRLQRRNPATGKVSGKSVSTEEWNAEKGIGNNITSLF